MADGMAVNAVNAPDEIFAIAVNAPDQKVADNAANMAAAEDGDANDATYRADSNNVTDDPLLFDVFPTNNLLKDMIAPMVNGFYETDNDGLPKVRLYDRVCWPFTECKCKGRSHEYSYNKMMLFANYTSVSCCSEVTTTTLHGLYTQLHFVEKYTNPETFSLTCGTILNTGIEENDRTKESIVTQFFWSIAMTHYATTKNTFDEKRPSL